MLLGNVEIGENVTGESRIELLKQFKDFGFYERLPIAKALLPTIDLSFLSMSKDGLPRFCFHLWPKEDEVKRCKMRIRFLSYTDELQVDFPNDHWTSCARNCICKAFHKNMEISSNREHEIGYGCSIGKDELKHFCSVYKTEQGEWLEISKSFHGLIPQEEKEKVKIARPFFDRIGIITEAENWQKTVIQQDPIIIGLFDNENESFLISHFNCTDIEDYIRKEFSESP